MDKKILIIYDYERIIPPFLKTLITIWLDMFDEIKYITAPMPECYIKQLNHSKISLVSWNKWQRIKQYFKGVSSVFRPSFWKEVFKGAVSYGAIANIGKFYFCSDGFIDISERLIKYNIKEGNNIYILATWFGVDAFTAARIKEKYPTAKAFVLAHSGEVMKNRNPYMHQTFQEYVLEKVNKVFFISQNVLKSYLHDMKDISLENRFGPKLSSIYLGSVKKTDLMNPESDNGTIQILSCSRIDANKRLDRIITTLLKWNGPKIKWTHIGSGILESEIIKAAEEMRKKKHNVEIHFTGRLDNSEVIEYYSKNHIDLFINVSKSEGLPISIMEAMSYGIPCVATNVGGTSEIVNDSNGFLLNQDFSDEDLNAVLCKFLMMDMHQKRNLRNNAYTMWANHFNAHNNAIRLFNEMQNIN